VIDYVALTITGETLDPEDVTRRLGVSPTKAFTRGEPNIHPIPPAFGYWRLTIKRPGGEVNSYLDDLITTFEGREQVVAELASRYGVEVTIVADLSGINEGEMTISSTLVTRLAMMSVRLRFYWLYGDE
jgi:hypothetical protein